MSVTLMILIAMSAGSLTLFIGILIAASARNAGAQRHEVSEGTQDLIGSLLELDVPAYVKEEHRRSTGHMIALLGAIVNLAAVLSLLFQTAWPSIRELF